MPSFITSAEVAKRLEMTTAEFYRARPKLIAEHGFPEPLAGFRTPHRYNAHAVTAWLANFKAGRTIALMPRVPGLAEVQAMRQRLQGSHNLHLLREAARAH